MPWSISGWLAATMVVGLVRDPQMTAGYHILALPTLVRQLPEPLKRVIGDLSSTERVSVGLDIHP